MATYWFGGGIFGMGEGGGDSFRVYGSNDPDSGFVDKGEGGGRGGKAAVAG